MKRFEFMASFGEVDMLVKLTLMNHGSIDILVGDYAYGAIINYLRIGWTVMINGDPNYFRGYLITQDDKDVLLERAAEAGLILQSR